MPFPVIANGAANQSLQMIRDNTIIGTRKRVRAAEQLYDLNQVTSPELVQVVLHGEQAIIDALLPPDPAAVAGENQGLVLRRIEQRLTSIEREMPCFCQL
jgi:hypothetical protein